MTPEGISTIFVNMSYVMEQRSFYLTESAFSPTTIQGWLNYNVNLLETWIRTDLTSDRLAWIQDCASW